MRRRGFIGILAGALLASRVEIFGAAPPVAAPAPRAFVAIINPAYDAAPFERVLYGAAGEARRQGNFLEWWQPGTPPKNQLREYASKDDLPPRFDYLPDKPGLHQVPPYILVPEGQDGD